ncbi:Major Facilitator Superfamily protein [Aspergillus parasiticus SU-1]|uniref:Major Facilitator Superfamily protein n=1 Tax=Aspergillus parasiticus (strain ATCC 56775 / NRRL 5862 / SRRC 143 / SU-1) TaxID=1403190 RepID=A0A0F0I4C8_ASPPU|nr:Major Facilitator Superfamily protein [Aspergillus parasiticus SU-1]
MSAITGSKNADSKDTMENTDTTYLRGIKLYSILSGVMIATFLISLDVSIIATAIPSITSQFHSTTDIGWYGAVYPLTMCSLQPLSGKLITIFSLRWSYLSFFLVFLLGSLLCGVATSSSMFIIGRAVAGTGGAGVVSSGLAVIAMVTPIEQCPLFTGLVTSLYALGTVVAPIIGGAFTTNVTWRWCFLVNLPAGAVTVITLILFFHPQKSPAARTETVRQKLQQLDLIGCALFVPAIIMVLLGLQWGGNKYSWNSATIIGLFVGFAATLGLFITRELRVDQAMIPLSLLRRRSIIVGIIFAFLFMGSYVVPVYYLPEWFQIVKGASPIRSAIMLLPSVSTQIFGSIISGVLAKYIKYYNPWLFIGSSFLCIATGLYTTFRAFSTTSRDWIGFQILQGLGCGFAAQMPLLTIQNVLKNDPKLVPVGISTVLFAQYFGSSVMQSIGGSIFQNKLDSQLRSYAHLDSDQIEMLLAVGTSKVQETAQQAFPDRLSAILIAYNDAITNVFYLAVAGSGIAFVLSLGIEWTNTRESTGDDEKDLPVAYNIREP